MTPPERLARPARDAAWMSGRLTTLPMRSILDTTDVDEAEMVTGSVLSDNRITVDGPRRDFRARIRECRVGDLWLAHFAFGAGVTVRTEPADFYALNFTLRGGSETRHGGTAVRADEYDAAMLSPRTARTLTWYGDTEVLCVKVPRQAMEQHFRKLGGPSAPIVFDLRVDATAAPWLRSVVAHALSTSRGDPGGGSDALSWHVRDAVLTAMLLELSHDRRDILRDPGSAATSKLCDAATAVMAGHLATPPPIPAIARQLGVSKRSLQASFREHHGTTPSARFKQMRLDAVRDALVRGDPERSTVMRIAAEVGGFAHHGRFAQEYFAAFGEHPSETLRR